MEKTDLPKGGLEPRARPLSSFIEQTALMPARPAEPSLVQAPAGFSIIQTAARPSIEGPSPGQAAARAAAGAEQLVEALGRFNSELTRTAGNVVGFWAKDQNEQGFNEVMRAQALVERQRQQSAQEYGEQNRQLARKDPLAAMAMDSINPFRMGGRKRALSQLAGQEIPQAIRLALQDPKLLIEPPESPALAEAKSRATASVLQKYGVQEGTPGFMEYVLPQLNRAWESAAAEQQDRRVKYLDNTVGRTGAVALLGQIKTLITNEGMTPEQAAKAVQTDLDGTLGSLGLPEKVDRYQEEILRRAWQMALEEGDAGALAALGAVLTGLPGAPTRMPAALAYGLELGEISHEVEGRQYTRVQRQRSEEERGIRETYLDLVDQGMDPQAAVEALVNDEGRFPNLGRSERLDALRGVIESEASISERLYDDVGFNDWIEGFRDAAVNGAWSDAERNAFLQQADEWVRNAPPGLRDRLRGEIRQVREGNDSANARGINGAASQAINDRISTNLGREYPEFSQSNADYNSRAWLTRQQDVAESRTRQRSAYTKHVNAYLAQKQAELGRRLTEGEVLTFTNEALDQYGKSDPDKARYLFPGGAASGEPTSVPGGKVEAPARAQPTRGGTKPQAQATPLPATYTLSTLENAPNIKDWDRQPLLDIDSAVDLIPSLLEGRPFPPSFIRAARKAGVTPGRLLLRQIEFYQEDGKPQIQLTPQQRQKILRVGQQRASIDSYVESVALGDPAPAQGGNSPQGMGGPDAFTMSGWARNWLLRLASPGYRSIDPGNPNDWRWRLRRPGGDTDPVGPGGGGYYAIGSLGNSTGPHGHIEKLSPDGSSSVNWNKAELDSFVTVNGKPLTAGTTHTSPYGMRVHPISGQRTMHHGHDFAAKEGSRLELRNGARWVSHKKGSQGIHSTFVTPNGSRYVILHGTFVSTGRTTAARGRRGPAGSFTGTNPTTMQSGFQALRRVGFPARGAAYLAGNIQQESSWRGRREWAFPNDGVRLGGLVSWRGPRLNQIEARLGKPISQASHAEQLRAMVEEMRTSYPSAYRTFMNPRATDAQLRQASRAYWGYGENEEGGRYRYAQQLAGD